MDESDPNARRIRDRIEEGALRAAAEQSRDLDEERLDVVELVRGTGGARDAAPDLTLGGYMDEHGRPPAFEGSDGMPYTVGIETEETGEGDRPFAAFFVFLRWAATGAGIMGHLESGDVARGASHEEARAAALDLSLYEVKAELDAAVERRRAELEDD